MNKKLIYIASKFQGKDENKNLVENVIKELIKENKRNKQEEYVYVSPIHTFGYMYDDVEYDVGMEMCFTLLSKVDELWVLPGFDKDTKSSGVLMEIGYAKCLGIPIVYL